MLPCSGLDIVWCAFLKNEFPGRPACLVTPSMAATHLNSHAIETYMSKDVAIKERSCTTTCKVLFSNFKSFWKNFSHHTGECYSIKGHHGLVASGSHYAVDGDGMIRARHGHGGLIRGMAAEPPESETEAVLSQVVKGLPRGIGATSIGSKDKRLSYLANALSKMCNAMPGLKLVLNVLTPEGKKSPTGRDLDVSLDARIRTTWINGPRALFWKRVLTPELLVEPIDFVWIFDADLAVHPALNPLPQLVHVLKGTEASVAFARPLSPSRAPVASAQSRAQDENCAAATVRHAQLSLSAVFKVEAWKLFHGNVLKRLDDPRLEQLEPGFDMLMCGLFGKRWADTGRPACVESHLWSTRLDERGRELTKAVTPSSSLRCEAIRCQQPLRRLYPSAYNASDHDDGRCWAAGPRGLTIQKWLRKPPGIKVRGGSGRG